MSEFTKIYVPLSRDEFMALRESAKQELRDPRDHARYLLRRVLFGKFADRSAPTKTVANRLTPEQV